jgi:hypothetical protein
MLTFVNLTFPCISLAISSTTGATILQGPHQGAQKSMKTGIVLLVTSLSKLESLTSITNSDILFPPFVFRVGPDPATISHSSRYANFWQYVPVKNKPPCKEQYENYEAFDIHKDTPHFFKIAIMGHQLENADWKRFNPTNTVKM